MSDDGEHGKYHIFWTHISILAHDAHADVDIYQTPQLSSAGEEVCFVHDVINHVIIKYTKYCMFWQFKIF